MTQEIDEVGRPEPPGVAGEAETLLGFLEFLRATFEWKTSGLTDEQLRVSLPPSTMTLGGMLGHLAFVEDYWFSLNVGRVAPVEPFGSADWDADPDFDWHLAADTSGADLRALWEQCVERSRLLVAEALGDEGAAALDREVTRYGSDDVVTLRWILVHMVEEYARHCGHADLIREAIDGLTGE